LANSFLYVFAIFTLFLVALLVSFKRRRRGNEAGRFLSLYYWSFLLSICIIYLVLTPYLAYFPHLFRSAQFFILLVMPLSYLYFRQTLHDKPPGLLDLLHLLPLLIFVIDYIPFFLLPGESKLEIWRGLNDYRLNAGLKEGWFMPEGAHIVIRYASMLIYWTLQFLLLFRIPYVQRIDISWESPSQLTWFRWLLWAQAILIFPSMYALVFVSKQLQSSLFALSALVSALIQGYFLFTHPEILYGLNSDSEKVGTSRVEVIQSGEEVGSITAQELNSSYLNLIDEPTLDRIEALLETLMEKEKVFLNPNLKVSDLTSAIGFGPHKLSAYFNKRCGLSFHDYINNLRVDYCAIKLESGEYKSKTLDALSSESGFQSRSTFIRAFKKWKGLTPSEFVQSLKKI
jgi:AraC-like DNA-binding protein